MNSAKFPFRMINSSIESAKEHFLILGYETLIEEEIADSGWNLYTGTIVTSGKSSDFLEKLKNGYEDVFIGDSFSIKFNGHHYDEESEEYPEEIAFLYQ